MKPVVAAVLLLVVAATLLLSGCESYDSMSGSGFTQRDLELQRKNADRARGF